MSTHPVLLGRVTGLNVGDTLDTPKREGQTSPPCHLDIEASQRPTVTRVTHGDSQSRPSWTWRCLQMSIALLVVIFTTWFAIDVGSWGSSDMVWMKDLSLISLMVSTGIAGLAANVAVPHCTNCTHPLCSTFFAPQLGGRLGDTKLNRCRSIGLGRSSPTIHLSCSTPWKLDVEVEPPAIGIRCLAISHSKSLAESLASTEPTRM